MVSYKALNTISESVFAVVSTISCGIKYTEKYLI